MCSLNLGKSRVLLRVGFSPFFICAVKKMNNFYLGGKKCYIGQSYPMRKSICDYRGKDITYNLLVTRQLLYYNQKSKNNWTATSLLPCYSFLILATNIGTYSWHCYKIYDSYYSLMLPLLSVVLSFARHFSIYITIWLLLQKMPLSLLVAPYSYRFVGVGVNVQADEKKKRGQLLFDHLPIQTLWALINGQCYEWWSL